MSARVALRDLLVELYRSAAQRRLLGSTLAPTAYQLAYEIYKRLIEAPGTRHLQRFAPAGATIIDVGANIGFFTLRFADWVGEHGRVLAIEPAPDHLAWLGRRLSARRLTGRVEVVAAVAADQSGVARLALNPLHPGDHRISNEGVEVKAVTVDELVATLAASPVTLIKIDVQGAEMRVVVGARRTLERFRPALLIEVDDAALKRYGTPAGALIDFLAAHHYAPYALTHRGIAAVAMTKDEFLGGAAAGYRDVLFLAS